MKVSIMEKNRESTQGEPKTTTRDSGILIKSRKDRIQSSRQSVTFREVPAYTPDRKASPEINQRELQRLLAARTIERAWMSYRDKKMFQLLKHATCAAENSLSYEILRKISPKECQLLQDKGMPIKVRFRFGGTEFPPMVYFKIYSDTSQAVTVKYMSGKKAIKPASTAAQEACDLMGKRKFLQIMVQDTMCHEKYKITDEMDVTTLKDYMQYLSHVDELPCYMGGKDNYWRKLTLDVIPRQTIFYDIVDFLYHNNMTERLKEEMPLLIQTPSDRTIHVHQIEVISRMHSPPVAGPFTTPKTNYTQSFKSQNSGRRSKQARSRADRMRRMYSGLTSTPTEAPIPSDDEDLDREADKLFQWTQELSFDELDRVPSMQAV